MSHEKSFDWRRTMQTVLHYADPWAVRDVESAFYGHPEAALRPVVTLSNNKRGAVAVAMCNAKMPRYAGKAA
ncbi:hypothetical protein SAMN05192539_100226 [Paraburkholderia diazotrophica]|uniref:Uncharacterized protein n=2 Tax=Paraburkholderia diazotrophica TaxID=667676 RepID=A0A1H6RCS0_9BURK|nr:hypothetical protein SAMN05192539_100226 [Paraburkholderia diazotrophica]